MEKKSRRDTSLIYLDEKGHCWIQEHEIGKKHPENAKMYSEIPKNEDKRWIDGVPNKTHTQFLTLSLFYPSQRLDVEIEIDSGSKFNINHQPFSNCKKYMDLEKLDFRLVQKYIELCVYEFGICHYEDKKHYKTLEVKADNKVDAYKKAYKENKKTDPYNLENIILLNTKPNPDYIEMHDENKINKLLDNLKKIKI